MSKPKKVGVMILKHPENMMNVIEGVNGRRSPMVVPFDAPSHNLEKLKLFGYDFVLMEHVKDNNVVATMTQLGIEQLIKKGKLFDKDKLNYLPSEYRMEGFKDEESGNKASSNPQPPVKKTQEEINAILKPYQDKVDELNSKLTNFQKEENALTEAGKNTKGVRKDIDKITKLLEAAKKELDAAKVSVKGDEA